LVPLPDKLPPTVKLFISDVDGCWTDGGMYFGAEGQLMKRFDVKDGYCVAMLAERGIPVIWLTADDSDITRARARRLNIAEMHVCVGDKSEGLREVLEDRGLTVEEVVYMGDDVNDLPVISRLPYTVCPSDAVAEVIAAVTWVSDRPGGHGAVRQVADALLRA
jgi:3-deoxy-D-manno-octulosonate 8-phosphate phosphatase (KDO 8-P phosphatase)